MRDYIFTNKLLISSNYTDTGYQESENFDSENSPVRFRSVCQCMKVMCLAIMAYFVR